MKDFDDSSRLDYLQNSDDFGNYWKRRLHPQRDVLIGGVVGPTVNRRLCIPIRPIQIPDQSSGAIPYDKQHLRAVAPHIRI